MSEKPGMKHSSAFEKSYLGHVQHEARMDTPETRKEHSLRLLAEVHEDLDDERSILSREEVVALLAKLDIAEEATGDFFIKATAQTYRNDIFERYPESKLERGE